MRTSLTIVTLILAGALGNVVNAAPSNLTVNNSGDGASTFCTTVCTLRSALANIADGGTIDFAPSLLPATISLTQGPLAIDKSVQLLGPGAERLAISAGGQFRVMALGDALMDAPISIDISGVTVRDGAIVGTSYAQAPAGSSGSLGGSALGGCIYVRNNTTYLFSLTIQGADIRNCIASGGNGGDGGTGSPSSGGLNPGGRGGNGGDGGGASGAAIGVDLLHAVSLTLVDTSISGTSAIAGNGGRGGDGGDGVLKGAGGDGGRGGNAAGASVFNAVASLDSLTRLVNTTIVGGTAKAGNGGTGGNGDPSLSTLPGGKGASGGNVIGGVMQFFLGNLAFATVVGPAAIGGSEGAGGGGKQPGTSGSPGQVLGSMLTSNAPTGNGESSILSTVIVGGTPAPLCYGAFIDLGANLDEDGSCNASLHGTFAQLFRPFDASVAQPALMPVYGSAIIDAAISCAYTNNPSDPTLPDDEHATPRPQSAKCDLGAIEADYIFVDGLEPL